MEAIVIANARCDSRLRDLEVVRPDSCPGHPSTGCTVLSNVDIDVSVTNRSLDRTLTTGTAGREQVVEGRAESLPPESVGGPREAAVMHLSREREISGSTLLLAISEGRCQL